MFSSCARMVLFLGIMVVSVGIVNAVCPCRDPSWCNPINNTSGKEVFMFSRPNDQATWKRYDWSRLTTVAMVGYISHDVMCYAHQHNARAVILADFSTADLLSASKRQAWIQTQLNTVRSNYLDGINIDFEGQIPRTRTDLRDGLNSLLKEASAAFRQALPHSQVTIDVPYGPNCVYNRCYDYKTLANYVDFFFVMDYDEGGGQYAGANSDYQKTRNGMRDYVAIVPADKLVLGVPWYGYKYACYNVTQDGRCSVNRGIKVRSYKFKDIIELQKQTHSVRSWDTNARSPYFTYKDPASNIQYQVWYDDVQSLSLKYMVASQYNLRGVGAWYADCLDYTDAAEPNRLRLAMWNAMPITSSSGTIIG
ncbi:di-N-acetylchitobiase-like [Haliotis rufescens]|uniref:di-N-acetylchitobiase-like n=1 Tax=Haliotis rufescens TaxID=6454 RepID=UPI00201F86D6|nr:di-N-acetylchitobiase-like [Haliotis rufescens]